MKRTILYFLLTIGCSYAHAISPNRYEMPAIQTFQSQQIMTSSTGYRGVVYTPFTSSLPSELNSTGAGSETSNRPHGHVRTFIGGPDQTGPSPIGEPWILAIFALAFAGVVAIRKTKKKLEI